MLEYTPTIATIGQWYMHPGTGNLYVLTTMESPEGGWLSGLFNVKTGQIWTVGIKKDHRVLTLCEQDWEQIMGSCGCRYLRPVKAEFKRGKG